MFQCICSPILRKIVCISASGQQVKSVPRVHNQEHAPPYLLLCFTEWVLVTTNSQLWGHTIQVHGGCRTIKFSVCACSQFCCMLFWFVISPVADRIKLQQLSTPRCRTSQPGLKMSCSHHDTVFWWELVQPAAAVESCVKTAIAALHTACNKLSQNIWAVQLKEFLSRGIAITCWWECDSVIQYKKCLVFVSIWSLLV